MAAKKTEQKIKVHNTEIVIGRRYKVVPKRDLSAPRPLNKGAEPTTKLPMPGIGEERAIPFDETQGRYDTGFETYSRIAREKKIPEAEINNYVKLVKEGYEKIYNKSIDANNVDFWDNYLYSVNLKKTFNTINPKDLMDLFQALYHGVLMNEGEKDALLQREAIYCLIDMDDEVDKSDSAADDKFDAIVALKALVNRYDGEKDDDLAIILEWLQYRDIRATDKEILKRNVVKSFDSERNGTDSIRRFLEATEMLKTKKGREEMEAFSIITRLDNKRKIDRKGGQLFVGDIKLGNNTKDAAKTYINNEDARKELNRLFENSN